MVDRPQLFTPRVEPLTISTERLPSSQSPPNHLGDAERNKHKLSLDLTKPNNEKSGCTLTTP